MRSSALACLGILTLCSTTFADDEKHLRYLPSDTKVTLTIHFTALDDRERTGMQELFHRLYRAFLVPELGTDTKLPLTDVGRVVVALPYAGSINGVFVLTGKLDRKQLEAQMGKAGVSVERMGSPAVPVYSRAIDEKALLELVPSLEKVPPRFRKLVAPQEVHVAAVDDQTLFLSLSGKKQIERALRARGSAGLRVAPELAALLRKQNPADVANNVLLEDSLHPGIALIADEATRETFGQFDHVQLRIHRGKEVRYEVELQAKTKELGPVLERKAKRVLDILREMLPTLYPDKTKRDVVATLLDSFKVSSKDERVLLTGQLTPDQWRTLLAPKAK